VNFDLNRLAKELHANATAHGFKGTTEDPRPIAEHVALIHSEVTEILEHWRSGLEPTALFYTNGTNGLPKPDGIPAECADVIIRVLNLCGEYGINIERALLEKVEYNKTRPWLHGGKRI